MSKKIEAVKNKVIARDLPHEEKTKGGIIKPANAESLPHTFGEVISVGNNVEFDVSPGDMIVYHQRGGQKIVFDDQTYSCLMDDEVYGVLKEDENENNEEE